jgi:hypothetical protein
MYADQNWSEVHLLKFFPNLRKILFTGKKGENYAYSAMPDHLLGGDFLFVERFPS